MLYKLVQVDRDPCVKVVLWVPYHEIAVLEAIWGMSLKVLNGWKIVNRVYTSSEVEYDRLCRVYGYQYVQDAYDKLRFPHFYKRPWWAYWLQLLTPSRRVREYERADIPAPTQEIGPAKTAGMYDCISAALEEFNAER